MPDGDESTVGGYRKASTLTHDKEPKECPNCGRMVDPRARPSGDGLKIWWVCTCDDPLNEREYQP